MDLETLSTYIETIATVGYGRAVEPGFLYSGGVERVWCESQAKAVELFTTEFTQYVQEHPGQLLWGEKPHMMDQKMYTKKPGNFFGEQKLYCAAASFEIVVQEDPWDSGELGRDERYAKRADPATEAAVDAAIKPS